MDITIDMALDLEELLGEMLFDASAMAELIELNDGNPIEWSYESRKSFLERSTRLVFMLRLPIACYPLSVAAAVTFDEPLCPP